MEKHKVDDKHKNCIILRLDGEEILLLNHDGIPVGGEIRVIRTDLGYRYEYFNMPEWDDEHQTFVGNLPTNGES